MQLTRKVLTGAASLAFFGCGVLFAQINAARHPHMAAAQDYGKKAYAELQKVEHFNKPAVDSHIEKAKHDLDEANHELDIAAATADGK